MPERNNTQPRIGLVQWQMRTATCLEDIMEQAEYYIARLATQKVDIAVFPEYFMLPLIAGLQVNSEAESMRELAKFTPEIAEKFVALAVEYKMNIVAGSMPQLRNNKLYNIGYLCHRSGQVDQYEKIHIPPGEVHNWGLNGGESLQIYETDSGRLGILICYDVEFPEVSRILAENSMEILIVPFFTTTHNGYQRVRLCARARAVENECYVAIVGAVGNMPHLKYAGTHYSQSAIFTPCDYAFPHNGILSEASANTEEVLIADLNLDLLYDLHHFGSVQNLKDRRIYSTSDGE